MRDKKAMHRKINADLYRYVRTTSRKGLFKGLRNPGFRFMYFLRKASFRKKYSPLGIWYRIILRRLSYKYGFQISPDTEIGEGFFIGHHGTIVMNNKAKIGKNCNIAHLTTIGETNRGRLKGCPSIGDMVWIGTGSVIVGKITIGSNVLIAPNSFVNFDVPDHSLVIGNPGKIIEKENPTEGYINHILA